MFVFSFDTTNEQGIHQESDLRSVSISALFLAGLSKW